MKNNNGYRVLNQDEFNRYETLQSYSEEEPEFNYVVQFHAVGTVYIKIFAIDNKFIGLVSTSGSSIGWEFYGENRLELAYDVIASHEHEYVRSAIASFWLPSSYEIARCKRNGSVPYKLLKRLSQDKSAIVRTSVTWSAGVTREILDTLARDADEMVRAAVASEPLTSPMTLAMLANDNSLTVLESLASNTSCPASTLAKISIISSDVLRNNLAGNPTTPHAILWKLLDEANDDWAGWAIREIIAGNPNAPRDLLLKLVALDVGHVWENLAKNPNTPQEAIVMMAEQTAGTSASSQD